MSSPSSTKPDTSSAAPHTGDSGTAAPGGKVGLPPVVWLLGAVAFIMRSARWAARSRALSPGSSPPER
ncbi:hypothetical protein [Streptomyces olivaceoviridis]|uniref:hypothetical protein n=1 Tax=Streptomyces olivaceoviridis TaxID=1921 RepID=UPI0036A03FBC